MDECFKSYPCKTYQSAVVFGYKACHWPFQLSTHNLQPTTFNLQLSTCNFQPATFNLQLSTCNFQPITLNPTDTGCRSALASA